MPALGDTPAKRSLSLRLPVCVIDKVEKYTKKNRLSKTDAFLFYLEQGFEKAEQEEDISLKDLKASVDSIKQLLTNGAPTERSVLTLEEISRYTAEAATGFPAINKAWIYGSYARNATTLSSDIELRLELDSKETFSLRDLAHFTKHLEQLTNKQVDAITAKKTIKNKNLREAIERDKVLIYERKTKCSCSHSRDHGHRRSNPATNQLVGLY